VFAFKLGFQLLRSVKALHTAGIAHGAIIPDNVFVFVNATTGGFSIDLGGFMSPRVSWLDTRTGNSLTRNIFSARASEAYLQSPWELAEGPSHRYTVRDDVYQAVQLVSIMLNGLDHDSELVGIGSTGNLAAHKLISPVLIPSLASNPLRCLPISLDSKTKLISKMHLLNAMIFDIQSVEYDAVIETLNEIAKISKTRHIVPIMRGETCAREHQVSSRVVPSQTPGTLARVSKPIGSARRVSYPSTEPEVRTFNQEDAVSSLRVSLKRGADHAHDGPLTPNGADPTKNEQRQRTA
jgi:hypothetical protein